MIKNTRALIAALALITVTAVGCGGPPPPPTAAVADRVHLGDTSPPCYADVEECFIPTHRPAHWVIFSADPVKGQSACQERVQTGLAGASCEVLPANSDPNGGPGRYVIADNSYQRGQRRCVEQLRHDANPKATCSVTAQTLGSG